MKRAPVPPDPAAVRRGAQRDRGRNGGGIVLLAVRYLPPSSSAMSPPRSPARSGPRSKVCAAFARAATSSCAHGRIGSAVVNLLTQAGKHVVVIDSHPDPTLIRRARESRIDLLTGDATNEDVLALCDVQRAAVVVVLTNSDPAIWRSRSARAPCIPTSRSWCASRTALRAATARLFRYRTFSPAALTAPAFAGLARFPGTLGRVRYAGEEHAIVQRWGGAGSQPPTSDGCRLLRLAGQSGHRADPPAGPKLSPATPCSTRCPWDGRCPRICHPERRACSALVEGRDRAGVGRNQRHGHRSILVDDAFGARGCARKTAG